MSSLKHEARRHHGDSGKKSDPSRTAKRRNERQSSEASEIPSFLEHGANEIRGHEDRNTDATSSSEIQPKLTVGAPDDEYELEADHVAERVQRTSNEEVGQPFEEEIDDISSSRGDLLQAQSLTPPYLQRLVAEDGGELGGQAGGAAIQAKADGTTAEASPSNVASAPAAMGTTHDGGGSGGYGMLTWRRSGTCRARSPTGEPRRRSAGLHRGGVPAFPQRTGAAPGR